MTPDVVPEPMIHVENPAFAELVEARATKLCLSAEPHTHSPAPAAPCVLHLSEARRAVMGEYIGQQGQVA